MRRRIWRRTWGTGWRRSQRIRSSAWSVWRSSKSSGDERWRSVVRPSWDLWPQEHLNLELQRMEESLKDTREELSSLLQQDMEDLKEARREVPLKV